MTKRLWNSHDTASFLRLHFSQTHTSTTTSLEGFFRVWLKERCEWNMGEVAFWLCIVMNDELVRYKRFLCARSSECCCCAGNTNLHGPITVSQSIVPVMETQDSKRLTRLIGLFLGDEATTVYTVEYRYEFLSAIINNLDVKNIKQQLWSKLTAGIMFVSTYSFPSLVFLSVIFCTHFINGSAFCPFPIHL